MPEESASHHIGLSLAASLTPALYYPSSAANSDGTILSISCLKPVVAINSFGPKGTCSFPGRITWGRGLNTHMVRSTLLWHPALAAPKREIGGVAGIWAWNMVFRIFQYREIIKPIWSTVVPDTSRCVDSESAIDFSLALHLMPEYRP